MHVNVVCNDVCTLSFVGHASKVSRQYSFYKAIAANRELFLTSFRMKMIYSVCWVSAFLTFYNKSRDSLHVNMYIFSRSKHSGDNRIIDIPTFNGRKIERNATKHLKVVSKWLSIMNLFHFSFQVSVLCGCVCAWVNVLNSHFHQAFSQELYYCSFRLHNSSQVIGLIHRIIFTEFYSFGWHIRILVGNEWKWFRIVKV